MLKSVQVLYIKTCTDLSIYCILYFFFEYILKKSKGKYSIMNVAVINLKDTFKYLKKILLVIVILFISIKYLSNSGQSLKKIITTDINLKFLTECIETSIPIFNKEENTIFKTIKVSSFINYELAMLEPVLDEDKLSILHAENNKPLNNENSQQQLVDEPITQTVSPAVQISKVAQTEEVTDKNYTPGYTDTYGTTKIDNESGYTLTYEIITPDAEITNKKDILIYHTHTCESYTPCNKYNYQMTGNYRTTDNNYNVVRVGAELTTYLTQKGFNVVHDATYHDYPAYSGSYSRSLETAERLLYGKNTEIVIDLHRDAIGNGDTYGPTVMIDGQRVAQLMFVIGTDGGGLEHQNWIHNLKIAIKIQETANKMYPGLFRPIIVRNSRYNQHIAKGASIIEVGATANTLEECLLSMQCLANVMEEVCN